MSRGQLPHLPVQSAGPLGGQGIGSQADWEQHGQQAEVQDEDERKEQVAGVGLLVGPPNPAEQPGLPRRWGSALGVGVGPATAGLALLQGTQEEDV